MLKHVHSKAGLNTYQIDDGSHDFAQLIQEIFKAHRKVAYTSYDGEDGEWYLFIDAPDVTVQTVITAALFTARSEWLKAQNAKNA